MDTVLRYKDYASDFLHVELRQSDLLEIKDWDSQSITEVVPRLSTEGLVELSLHLSLNLKNNDK